MSHPQINPGTVLMAAAELFNARYAKDEDVWVPLQECRWRENALDDCAQMAWSLALKVQRFAPSADQVIPLRPQLMPEKPWTETVKEA